MTTTPPTTPTTPTTPTPATRPTPPTRSTPPAPTPLTTPATMPLVGYQPARSAAPDRRPDHRLLRPDHRPQQGRPIDQLRFAVGAGLSAGVTAVVGALGLLAAHGIAHVPVLFAADGRLTAVPALSYALLAAGVTLAAAGLYDAMLHAAPRPTTYFTWLMTALTLLAVIVPFTLGAPLGSAIALAAVNLLAGSVILGLVPLAADTSSRR